MTTIEIDDELEPLLKSLESSRPAGRRTRRRILNAGAESLAADVRRAAPGKGRRLRRATTHTVDERAGDISARAGINIASKRGVAPYAVWRIKGTKLRATKRGANRGRMRGDDYFSRAVRTGTPTAIQEMRDELEDTFG